MRNISPDLHYFAFALQAYAKESMPIEIGGVHCFGHAQTILSAVNQRARLRLTLQEAYSKLVAAEKRSEIILTALCDVFPNWFGTTSAQATVRDELIAEGLAVAANKAHMAISILERAPTAWIKAHRDQPHVPSKRYYGRNNQFDSWTQG